MKIRRQALPLCLAPAAGASLRTGRTPLIRAPYPAWLFSVLFCLFRMIVEGCAIGRRISGECLRLGFFSCRMAFAASLLRSGVCRWRTLWHRKTPRSFVQALSCRTNGVLLQRSAVFDLLLSLQGSPTRCRPSQMIWCRLISASFFLSCGVNFALPGASLLLQS